MTSEEPDATLALLDRLEDPDSPVRAVVSVSMLKEGGTSRTSTSSPLSGRWSPTCSPSRSSAAGCGCRSDSGPATPCSTRSRSSHRSFASLLKQAKSLLNKPWVTGSTRRPSSSIPVSANTQPVLPSGSRASLTDFAFPTSGTVEFELPGAAATDPSQDTLFDVEESDNEGGSSRHTGLMVSTLDDRVGAGAASVERSAGAQAATPGGVTIPLFLPSVVTRGSEIPFTLASINLGLGRSARADICQDNAPTLTRKAIDAERDSSGEAHVVIRDQIERVIATQTAMPFDTIENDLVGLIRTNAVEASVTELNAAVAVARAFPFGAGVTETTPWRPEHGRLATARLTEWIAAKQTSSPAREVRRSGLCGRWPEPSERFETRTRS